MRPSPSLSSILLALVTAAPQLVAGCFRVKCDLTFICVTTPEAVITELCAKFQETKLKGGLSVAGNDGCGYGYPPLVVDAGYSANCQGDAKKFIRIGDFMIWRANDDGSTAETLQGLSFSVKNGGTTRSSGILDLDLFLRIFFLG